MKKLKQSFSVKFEYDVHFTRDLFRIDNELFADVVKASSEMRPAKMLIVIDSGLSDHHPELFHQIEAYVNQRPTSLQLCGSPIIVPGGEASKNDPGLILQLLEAINEWNIDRHSLVIALGGGAVLDMAGLAATVAHRGIRHIRIPTTVLAQNDSGIGVKNGINFFGKKNFLGAFAPPLAVINDFAFLATLDIRDWRSGIAEAVKVALIRDAGFFRFLESEAGALALRQERPMEQLIYECARHHMEHIASGDPFEMGSSRPLDFGHWAAHKLEQLSNYRLRHGEAVAIGIALDSTYSYLSGMLPKTEWERIIELLQQLGFDLFAPELIQKEKGELAVLAGLEEFREHLGGQLTIMLLEAVGKGIEVHDMERELIRQSIHTLEQLPVKSLNF